MKKHDWNLVLVVVATLVVAARAADRPNILLIMADDCTFNDLPLYGGQGPRQTAGVLSLQTSYRLRPQLCTQSHTAA